MEKVCMLLVSFHLCVNNVSMETGLDEGKLNSTKLKTDYVSHPDRTEGDIDL